jgi:hypothetical protein
MKRKQSKARKGWSRRTRRKTEKNNNQISNRKVHIVKEAREMVVSVFM